MRGEGNVSIRPYRLEDAPELLAAALESVWEVRPFQPWCRPDLTLAEMREWVALQVAAFAEGTAFEHVIESADGRYLGGCGLNLLDTANRRANLGYWVRTSDTRRGVATAAVRQLVRWAFTHTDLIRLEVVVATGNAASLRVAEKAGAVREGVLRRRLLVHGVAQDAVVLSFVREEG